MTACWMKHISDKTAVAFCGKSGWALWVVQKLQKQCLFKIVFFFVQIFHSSISRIVEACTHLVQKQDDGDSLKNSVVDDCVEDCPTLKSLSFKEKNHISV